MQIEVFIILFVVVPLAGITAKLITKDTKGFINNLKFALIFIAFLAVFGTVEKLIASGVQKWQRKREVSTYLQKDPLYSRILANNPALRQQLENTFARSGEGGKAKDAAIQEAIPFLSAELPKYVSRTSDHLVVEYVRSIVAVLTELSDRGAQYCYYYLYPRDQHYIVPARYIDAQTVSIQNNTTLSVIDEAVMNPQQIPDCKLAEPLMNKVVRKLHRRFGNDILLLEDMGSPDADQEKVCSLVIALYNEVLALSEKERVLTLRCMFAEQQP